jgi:hypothetical protein
VDRVTGRDKSLQGMEVKPGKIHLFHSVDDIQAIETNKNAFMKPGIDFCGTSF